MNFEVEVKADAVDDASRAYIRSTFIYPYYNSSAFRPNNQLSWTSDTRSYSFYSSNFTQPQSIEQRIIQNTLWIYNFALLDTVQLPALFNCGHIIPTYRPMNHAQIYYETHYPDTLDKFKYYIMQGRDQTTNLWWIKALNTVVGQIGGYSALLWLFLRFLFDEYENFKFSNSIIRNVYSCTPQGPEGQPRQGKALSSAKVREHRTQEDPAG